MVEAPFTSCPFFVTDLCNTYFHVPIALEYRCFLRFASQGQVFQVQKISFRISLAQGIFTRCMQLFAHESKEYKDTGIFGGLEIDLIRMLATLKCKLTLILRDRDSDAVV